jgi:type IX secretion system PorP/SprF family membrane protein
MLSLSPKSITLSIFLALSFIGYGQQFPLYTQYMFNPYLVNPSILARTTQSEINILYRQQYTGLADGPKTLQFDYQHAFNNQLAFGVNVYNDETVLISNLAAMATFGYRVALASEHTLGFGLSAGFLSNRLKREDIPDIDANDPAIQNYIDRTVFNGAFGLSYVYKKLTVGFSFIRLFDNNLSYLSTENELTFSQLQDKIVFAGYNFDISENFSVQPNFSYRFTLDRLNFFETSAFFSYKKMFGIGGGYREGFGPLAMARVSFKDLEIGFAYDFPSPDPAVSLGGTNEFQLKWEFGKTLEKSSKSKKSTVLKPALEDVVIPPVEEKREEAVELPPVIEQPVAPQPEVIPAEEIKAEEFILVVGSFKIRANAERFARELRRQGYEAEIYQPDQSDYAYVHLSQFKTTVITVDKLLEIRKGIPFKDAWFRKMN